MFEKQFFDQYQFIIGCDEVGRGPIAGPVVGCAVKIPTDQRYFKKLRKLGVTDSKKVTALKRQAILEKLRIEVHELECQATYESDCLEFVLWEHSPDEIDQMNILNASLSCMAQAAQKLYCTESMVLVDGNQRFRHVDIDALPVIGGDSKSIAIAMASILAKEFRDEKMRLMDSLYPGYGLASHAGYPTKYHLQAVASLGVTPIHRKTFKGVKEYLQS